MDEKAGGNPTLVRRMLTEAREDVANADQKASTVLAGLGVGVGAVIGGVLAGDWRPTSLQFAAMVVWWAGTVAVMAAMACAAFAVWPRYTSRHSADGVYSWAHVASYGSVEAFSTALDTTDPLARTRYQLWAISKIVATKSRLVRWAMGLAGTSLALISASVILDAILR